MCTNYLLAFSKVVSVIIFANVLKMAGYLSTCRKKNEKDFRCELSLVR